MSYILRGSKKALVGLGLAGCGAAAAVILGYADNNQFRVSAADLPQSLAAKLAPFATNIQPRNDSKWDSNWDKREPEYLVKPLKGRFNSSVPSANDENTINERIEKAKAVASRHLILVCMGVCDYSLEVSSSHWCSFPFRIHYTNYDLFHMKPPLKGEAWTI